MFTLVFIFCIRFLIRFSSRSHRLTIWDMMGAAPAATSLLLIAFVCVRLPVLLILIFVLLLLRPMAATEAAAATRAVAVRCFWGAFANECDLDLSSWFIILRCLRSCCCRCRCRCRCCCCSCCCVCAFVLLCCSPPNALDWCCCCSSDGSGSTAVLYLD